MSGVVDDVAQSLVRIDWKVGKGPECKPTNITVAMVYREWCGESDGCEEGSDEERGEAHSCER